MDFRLVAPEETRLSVVASTLSPVTCSHMCGICGIFNFGTQEPVDREGLKQTTDAMIHRGPDDEGFFTDRELGLGNRRLSIIDLPGGHRPLSHQDQTDCTTFNGAVY